MYEYMVEEKNFPLQKKYKKQGPYKNLDSSFGFLKPNKKHEKKA